VTPIVQFIITPKFKLFFLICDSAKKKKIKIIKNKLPTNLGNVVNNLVTMFVQNKVFSLNYFEFLGFYKILFEHKKKKSLPMDKVT
jgi:hypothetical protein